MRKAAATMVVPKRTPMITCPSALVFWDRERERMVRYRPDAQTHNVPPNRTPSSHQANFADVER